MISVWCCDRIEIRPGKLLHSRRVTLSTSRVDSRVAHKRREEILRVNLASDDLLQERQDFLALKNKIYEQLDDLEPSLTKEQIDMLTTQALLLLESRQKLLEETGNAYIKYLKELNAQEAAQKSIDALSGKYRNYIDQRLLWIQSSGVFEIKGGKGRGVAGKSVH